MHFCSKPVFNICDQTCQAGTDEEKRTKVLGEDRREGKLNYSQNSNADSSCNASNAVGH